MSTPTSRARSTCSRRPWPPGNPHSETLSTFALASLSGALAAGAVGTLAPALLLYPVYFCLVNGALALMLHHRRAVLQGVGVFACVALDAMSSPGRDGL